MKPRNPSKRGKPTCYGKILPKTEYKKLSNYCEHCPHLEDCNRRILYSMDKHPVESLKEIEKKLGE